MKFGVREICDVVFKATKSGHIGKYKYDVGQPILYIDSAKTSAIEGAATTVYATGGRGNSRLIAWEGEKTLTFTVEDALLSEKSFAMLSGAGLINKGIGDGLSTTAVHQNSQITFYIEKMEGEECFDANKWLTENEGAGQYVSYDSESNILQGKDEPQPISLESSGNYYNNVKYQITFTHEGKDAGLPAPNLELNGKSISSGDIILGQDIPKVIITFLGGVACSTILSIKSLTYTANYIYQNNDPLKNLSSSDPCFIISLSSKDNFGQKIMGTLNTTDSTKLVLNNINYESAEDEFELPVFIDYYTRAKTAVTELVIDAENFADNYYVEAKTNFRRQADGKDLDAMLTFPNVKIQSNFTFNMAATGDPSTFTFTMDAMPGYTLQNPNKKVLCLMQIVNDDIDNITRIETRDSVQSMIITPRSAEVAPEDTITFSLLNEFASEEENNNIIWTFFPERALEGGSSSQIGGSTYTIGPFSSASAGTIGRITATTNTGKKAVAELYIVE